jgi:hypothetical protein
MKHDRCSQEVPQGQHAKSGKGLFPLMNAHFNVPATLPTGNSDVELLHLPEAQEVTSAKTASKGG